MATNTSGTQARQDPRQVSNTMRGSISFSNISATAVFVPIGVLPKGAWVIAVQLSVDTVFNAGSGNTIDVGTAGTPTQFISGGNAASAVVSAAPVTGLGKAAAAAADTVVGLRYNFGSTAPTTGALEVLIEYEGGFPATAGVEFSG
jgi:hypothetical protein